MGVGSSAWEAHPDPASNSAVMINIAVERSISAPLVLAFLKGISFSFRIEVYPSL
jgi:hypothetical protein